MNFYRLMFCILMLLAITSCNSTPVVINSPVSPPATPTTLATQIPTPTPTMTAPQAKIGFGAVYGQIIGKKNQPLKDMRVRLGEILKLTGPEGGELVTSDRYRSPQAITNENGYFIIENISPNKYGIVVDNPDEDAPFFISELSGKKLKVVEIKAESVLRIGQLQIPIDNPQ